MKKILSAIVGLVILVNFSVCQAGNIRLADEGVETFYSSISNVHSQVNTKISLSNLLRTANLDMPEYMRAWTCWYYLDGYSEPIGEIIFFVNNEGYVYMAKIVSYFNQTEGLAGLIASIFLTAGATPEEIETMFENVTESNNIRVYSFWSHLRNKEFSLMELPRFTSSEGKQFVLMGGNK